MKEKRIKKIAIVGFGRFGKTLLRLLNDDFEISIFDINKTEFTKIDKDLKVKVLTKEKEIFDSEVIIYAVPISAFEETISRHCKYFNSHLLIDVLSVKVFSKRVFEKYLITKQTKAILTHPLFGPDSAKQGFENLPFVIDKFSADEKSYSFWKEYFKSKKLNVIEMSADEHDRKAAYAQGITHFLGRVLDEMALIPTEIDTLGAKKLLEIREQTCNDTWQLFCDLQTYNPYTKQMRVDIGEAFDKIFNKLLPTRIDEKILYVGIQGGRGSFNEEAAKYYLERSEEKNYKLVFLYTTEAVLDALRRGEIDRGQFAIHNSLGGVVGESIKAMANYKFDIIEEFAIKISHALMIHRNAKLSQIQKIMTHPQVLKQCRDNLEKKYSNIELTSGKGVLVDHSKVAEEISLGRIEPIVAIIGSKILAEIYNLKIIEENLQDLEDNFTSFLWVKRKN